MRSDSPTTDGFERLLPDLSRRSRAAADQRVLAQPQNIAWYTSVQAKVFLSPLEISD
jgi:hypothetical protein